MFWSSITKHWPVPPYTSPVPPSNNQCRPLPTHPPLLTQFLQVPTSSALVLTQCHQIRTGIWKNINLHIFIYLISSSFSTLQHINSHQGLSFNRATCHFGIHKMLLMGSIDTVWQFSRLSRNFQTCSKTSHTQPKLSRLSGDLPDSLEIFKIVWKLWRLSGNFPDWLEFFRLARLLQMFCKLSRWARTFQPGKNSPECLESFLTV